MRLTTSIALAVVAFALAGGLAACSDDSTESEATIAVEVFSFTEHDLCEWVAEAEVAEWVAAEFDWDRTPTASETTDATVACTWTLGSTGSVVVTASDAALWRGFDGNLYDFNARMAEAGVTEYPSSEGFVEIGAWVVGHPAVSDGVVVHNGGFGQFAFGVPPGPWLQVSVASQQYEADYFAVADRFLQELGWVS